MKGAIWTFNLLGTIAAALALFSFAQHMAAFGLSETTGVVLTAYRAFVAPLQAAAIGVIEWLGISWQLPDWYGDLLVVSAVGATSSSRVVLANPAELGAGMPLAVLVPWQTLVTVIASVTLFGCVLLVSAVPLLLADAYIGDARERPPHIAAGTQMARQGMFGVAGAVVFFALNAFGA